MNIENIDPNHEDRLSSEKKFHNKRFKSSDDSDKRSRFYFALEDWYVDYFNKIMACRATKVLEMGSGVESLALQLKNIDFEFISIDISEEAIKFIDQSKYRAKGTFLVADAHNTYFPNESFDLIVGRGILHHLNIPVVAKEIKRLLKPGGKFIFGEPLDCNPFINAYRFFTPKIRTPDEQPLNASAIKLLRSDLGDFQITYYGFLTLGPAILGIKPPRFLRAFDRFLLNRLGLGRLLAWACILTTVSD